VYGTATQAGLSGFNYGTVYELTPSGTGWTENTVYLFRGQSDGWGPYGGLTFNGAGDLIGTTSAGGSDTYGGTVFELTPNGGGWTYNLLYNFPSDGIDHTGPYARLCP
jgi:hypothetical protein